MPNAEYIKALLEGQDPPGSVPTDLPWVELSTRLQEIPVPDRQAGMVRWAFTAGRDGGELISALTALQCGGREIPILGRVWTVSSLLEQNLGNYQSLSRFL